MNRGLFLLSAVVLLGLATHVVMQQPGAFAQEATPAACATTTEAENTALAIRYTEERRSDPEVNATLLAAEVKRHRVRGDQIYTATEAVAVDRAFGAAFPDLKVTVDEVVADGDLVAVAWTAEGTNLGEFYGVPATGKTAQWEGLDLMRFTCGKISEVWVSADALGLHMQLGAITEEERTSVGTPAP